MFNLGRRGYKVFFVALDFCLTALYNSVTGDIYLAYSCKIIEDSISPAGARLTTLEVCFPRMILAEFNTHRAFCLAGDAELELDLPGATRGSKHRVYHIKISDFVDKWESKPEHWQIRQLNEETGKIIYSSVVNATSSGVKRVYEVQAAGYKVAGSADHKVLTEVGWKTIGEIIPGDKVVVQKFGKEQGWQGGAYLYGGYAVVSAVVYRGEEETYDLEIAGDFPNFLANKIVVHNSRNSASSRAIPIAKMITSVKRDPFVPFHWGKNQSGMQADLELTGWRRRLAIFAWLRGRDAAVLLTRVLALAGCHKQTANRVLEPWLYHTVIVTSTEWDNFFKQRCDPAAQPEIRLIADMMKIALSKSQPVRREFHLPYVTPDEIGVYYKPELFKLSVARCARVSYLNHDGTNDIKRDLGLYKKLIANGHMSPAEHQATAIAMPHEHSGNFTGWKQYRKVLEEEVVRGN